MIFFCKIGSDVFSFIPDFSNFTTLSLSLAINLAKKVC